MSELKLIAHSFWRNERHARIGVFQNGALAGVLTISAEHEAAVLGAINGHEDLLEVCEKLVKIAEVVGNCVGTFTPDRDSAEARQTAAEARAAIAKAEGTAPDAQAERI